MQKKVPDYSPKSLIEKLGIKPGMTIAIMNAPDDYEQTLGALPGGVTTINVPASGTSWMQYFVFTRYTLEVRMPRFAKSLTKDGQLWICWPKKSSGVQTNLDDNVVREVGLQNGLVDVKVCAIDDTWSGLKFVFRKKER